MILRVQQRYVPLALARVLLMLLVTSFARRLSKRDQERVFPNSVSFDCPEDQEAFVREWAQKRTGLACDFKVKFYPGRYAPEKGEQAKVA